MRGTTKLFANIFCYYFHIHHCPVRFRDSSFVLLSERLVDSNRCPSSGSAGPLRRASSNDLAGGGSAKPEDRQCGSHVVVLQRERLGDRLLFRSALACRNVDGRAHVSRERPGPAPRVPLDSRTPPG